MKAINCTCGKNLWEWCLDGVTRSWIKCAGCGDKMFGPDIGVILIHWGSTSLTDVHPGDLGDIIDTSRSETVQGE